MDTRADHSCLDHSYFKTRTHISDQVTLQTERSSLCMDKNYSSLIWDSVVFFNFHNCWHGHLHIIGSDFLTHSTCYLTYGINIWSMVTRLSTTLLFLRVLIALADDCPYKEILNKFSEITGTSITHKQTTHGVEHVIETTGLPVKQSQATLSRKKSKQEFIMQQGLR